METTQIKSQATATLQDLSFLLPMEKFLMEWADARIQEWIESARKISLKTIERNISEESFEIDFILSQVRAEPGSYSENCFREIAKDVFVRKARIAIMKSERARRASDDETEPGYFM